MRGDVREWQDFLDRMRFGEPVAPFDPPPTPRQMLGEIAAAMAIVVYMIAVIAIIGWMFGH